MPAATTHANVQCRQHAAPVPPPTPTCLRPLTHRQASPFVDDQHRYFHTSRPPTVPVSRHGMPPNVTRDLVGRAPSRHQSSARESWGRLPRCAAMADSWPARRRPCRARRPLFIHGHLSSLDADHGTGNHPPLFFFFFFPPPPPDSPCGHAADASASSSAAFILKECGPAQADT